MLIIGLTGGIGSGKSLISDLFADLGITVSDADVVARKVVEPKNEALKTIVSYFGKYILLSDGTLNRNKLRNIILHDLEAKQWLERLLHPLIEQEQLNIIKNATSPYSLLVSPLLIEANQTKYCQRIILVKSEKDIKIRRIMQRDNVSYTDAHLIISQQMTDEQRMDFIDDVIENNSTPEQAKLKVYQLHSLYLSLCT